MDIFVLRNGVKLGPYTESKVRNLLDSGLVTDQDMGWRDGLPDWTPIGLIAHVQSSTQSEIVTTGTGVSRKAFRILVGVSVLLVIVTVLYFALETTPDSSTPTGTESSNANSGFLTFVEYTVLIVWCILYLVSTIGLFLIRKWGRFLFALALVVFVVNGFLTPNDASTSAEDLLTNLIVFSWGGITALAFLTTLFDVQKLAAVSAK